MSITSTVYEHSTLARKSAARRLCAPNHARLSSGLVAEERVVQGLKHAPLVPQTLLRSRPSGSDKNKKNHTEGKGHRCVTGAGEQAHHRGAAPSRRFP